MVTLLLRDVAGYGFGSRWLTKRVYGDVLVTDVQHFQGLGTTRGLQHDTVALR